MPGPYFNWRLLADVPAELSWYMIVNARRTGRINQRFLDEAPELFLQEQPPRVFPIKLIAGLQMQSHVMSYRFSDDPEERETYGRMVAGDEAALSVARDFCRLTWMDGVYALPIEPTDIRNFATNPTSFKSALPPDDPRPRVTYAAATDELLRALTNRPVRAGEIVSFAGDTWLVGQFMARTRGAIKVEPFAYLDVPFDPDFMDLDAVSLVPSRYALVD